MNNNINYSHRGFGFLVMSLCSFAIGAAMCFFENTRTVGIAVMIISFAYLFVFWFYRKMTPEEYKKATEKRKGRK